MPFAQGDIVIVPFPFSDLKGQKKRPAIVISSDILNASSADIVLAQITSNLRRDTYSFHLHQSYLTNSLIMDSEVRCHKILTVEQSIIVKTISSLTNPHLQNLLDQIGQTVFGK